MEEANYSHPIGGPEYMRLYPGSAWPYLIIAGTASVVGTIGNLLILGSVYVYKHLRRARNVFIVNLALADLTVTAFADPMGILGMVRGKEFFEQRPVLCDIAATVCLGACVTALLSIGGVSFNRCIHICHGSLYKRIFGFRSNVCMCVVFWICGFAFSLPGLVGWTDNVYDHKMLECIWDRTNSLSYTIFFSGLVVFTPTLIIAASYVRIFTYVRASRRTVAAISQNADYMTKSRAASIRVARTLFIIFAVFVFCWSPYALLVLADFGDRAPPEVHLYILLLAHLHATLNAIVYCATNKHFRNGYITVLARLVRVRIKIIHGKSEYHGSSTTGGNKSMKSSTFDSSDNRV